MARNLYGRMIDEILMRTDNVLHQTYYYQQDHEGSVTHLTDGTGTIIENYKYDAFGAPTIYNASGTAHGNRALFTGREYDSTFGIYEYRARAYHPGLGRFMSEDPKGFAAGDYNLFRYCHNDPEDLTDPMGLEVGFGESLIPIWGEGRLAYDSYHEGHYGMMAFHAAMAVSDASIVKGALGALVKGGIKAVGKVAAEKVAAKAGEEKAAARAAEEAGMAGSRTEALHDAKRAWDIPVSNSPTPR